MGGVQNSLCLKSLVHIQNACYNMFPFFPHTPLSWSLTEIKFLFFHSVCSCHKKNKKDSETYAITQLMVQGTGKVLNYKIKTLAHYCLQSEAEQRSGANCKNLTLKLQIAWFYVFLLSDQFLELIFKASYKNPFSSTICYDILSLSSLKFSNRCPIYNRFSSPSS